MPDRDTENYRGREVVKGWSQKVESAQERTREVINNEEFERVPFGAERDAFEPIEGTCPDCAAPVGWLHVPGCDIEECPRCGGQSLSCECEYADTLDDA